MPRSSNSTLTTQPWPTQRKKRPSRLERYEEDAVVRWAKKNGIGARKMNGAGNRSWPDRMFYSKKFKEGCRVVFIEMKRRGAKLTEQQADKINELRECGIPAEWFDNCEEAIKWLDGMLA